jgi:hypothetical protein
MKSVSFTLPVPASNQHNPPKKRLLPLLLFCAQLLAMFFHHHSALTSDWFETTVTISLPQFLGGSDLSQVYFKLGFRQMCSSTDNDHWKCVNPPSCGVACGEWTVARTAIWVSGGFIWIAILALGWTVWKGLNYTGEKVISAIKWSCLVAGA